MLSIPENTIADDLLVRARVDREAFGELYDMIYPPIFRYCLRRVNHRSLAEDITSTVFLSVAKNIATFGGNTYQEFRRWVFTITTNEINADYRKTTRRKALIADTGDPADIGKSTIVERGPDTVATVDAVLIASLVEVNAHRNEISSETYFRMLGICQQEHEARLLDLDTARTHWYHESTFPPTPVPSPKG